MFHVIALDTGEPVCDGDSQEPNVYSNGRSAASAARVYTTIRGKKHQPRRIMAVEGIDWEKREQDKFNNGEYIKLPWARDRWFQDTHKPLKHYAHVSKGKVGMVAFTESPEKGAADIQTRMRPGTYLTRFYRDALMKAAYGNDRPPADTSYVDRIIERQAKEFHALYDEIEVKFARTADEFEHVYRNGPRSCMSYLPEEYESKTYPVRVYAAGDVECAYITDPADSKRITGRALVRVNNGDKKLHGRLYGDETRMQQGLKQLGYRHADDCLQGARLTRIEQDDGFVCPYIDYIFRVRDDGDYLVIDRHGDISAEETCGLVGTVPHWTCDHCGDRVDEENTYNVQGSTWCEGCTNDSAFFCNRYEEYYNSDYSESVEVWVPGYRNAPYQQLWCYDAARTYAWECDETGDWYSDRIAGVTMADGRTVCEKWFDDNGFHCDECGDNYDNDDREEHEHDKPAADPLACTAGKHTPKQGRDEHPSQGEIDLTNSYRAGDVVNVRGGSVRLIRNGSTSDNLWFVEVVSHEPPPPPRRPMLPPVGHQYWFHQDDLGAVVSRTFSMGTVSVPAAA